MLTPGYCGFDIAALMLARDLRDLAASAALRRL
jgi:hypothetical protein